MSGFHLIPARGQVARDEIKADEEALHEEVDEIKEEEHELKAKDPNMASMASVAARDMQEVANLRGRRRRNRQRRAMRRGGGASMVKTTIGSLFSGDLRSFAEAVTNPFDDGAIGAIMPDQWQPPTIPALDRLTFDWPTTQFQTNPDDQLGSTIFAIVPRCLAAGWWQSGFPLAGQTFVEFVDLEPTLVNSGVTVVPTMAQNPYVLIAAQALNRQWACLTGAGPIQPGYNSIQFARSDVARSNLAGTRIVGAGLKVWSDEAPINTGGTCYGGWMTVQELFDSLGSNPTNGGRQGLQPPSVQDGLRYRKINQGVQGVTVRYSPLQSAEQEEYQDFALPDDMVTHDQTFGNQAINIAAGVQFSDYDLVRPSTSVPVVVWNYGSNDFADAYSLRVQAVVHLQGKPVPLSPFMMVTPHPDPLYQHLAMLLEDKETFPVACTGHSFKKFLNKALKFGHKVFKHGDDIAKFITLAQSFI